MEVLTWLSPRQLILQENYTVWHFGLSRNPGNGFARQFRRQQMWYIVCLYENFFCFKKKFLPPLDPVVFSKHFYPRPRWCFAKLTLSYSTSDNETPPISWVLIGRPLIFCWLTSPRAVTRLENVRQSNIRGKKMGFQLSHKHPPFSLTLQPCSLDFLTPASTDFKKNVSFWVFCNSWKFD